MQLPLPLDHAVLDAYGRPHHFSDEEILKRLLALNLERQPDMTNLPNLSCLATRKGMEHLSEIC